MTRFDESEAPGRERRLAGSRGFRVDSPAGELGTVAEVLPPSSPDRPEALAIALDGRAGPLLVVAVDDVERIFPAERRLRLRTPPREPRS